MSSDVGTWWPSEEFLARKIQGAVRKAFCNDKITPQSLMCEDKGTSLSRLFQKEPDSLRPFEKPDSKDAANDRYPFVGRNSKLQWYIQDEEVLLSITGNRDNRC